MSDMRGSPEVEFDNKSITSATASESVAEDLAREDSEQPTRPLTPQKEEDEEEEGGKETPKDEKEQNDVGVPSSVLALSSLDEITEAVANMTEKQRDEYVEKKMDQLCEDGLLDAKFEEELQAKLCEMSSEELDKYLEETLVLDGVH